MTKSLKEKMAEGPVFGMTLYGGSPAIVEILGHWGYDFAFLDAEHTPMGVDRDMEKLIMAARLAGISALVRIPDVNAASIRKSFEMGAEGVIIPHVKTKGEVEACVQAARFPPDGRRGFDSTVRAARYGAKGYGHDEYFRTCGNNLVIPMAEDFEFTDNIDDILDASGIDVINFGPSDYALSTNRKTFYDMRHPETQRIQALIVEKAHKKGIKVMSPVLPPTLEDIRSARRAGVDMMVVG
ncbi:MAG: 2,4-dihydroxyhept-2-ene-1,7-dioic acid aldolase, partial [Planctomycetota bacterium]|nr:2,4-dihydroxyhept-2-ene-1,7-dioic acid aldolase [Planctomycetota bacterium]